MAWTEEQSVPRQDKNAGSVFEQRAALARLRAHLRDEVRITRDERAGMRTATLRSVHAIRVGAKPTAQVFKNSITFYRRKKTCFFKQVS